MSFLKEYRRLLPYLRKYSLMYIPGLICLVVTDAGQLVIPRFTKKAVDMIASSGVNFSELADTLILMVVIAVLIAVGRFGWRFFIGGTSRRIESGLREQLFSHLMKLSPSFFESRKTGDIMARFTNDMNAIRMACGIAIVSLVDGVFMTAFILVVLFRNYPQLAGWIIIPLPLLSFLVLGAGRLLGHRSKLVQESFSNLSAQAQETFTGIRVLKTLAQEKFAVRKFRRANDQYMQRAMSLIRVWGFLFPMIHFLSGMTSLLLLWFGGKQVIAGGLTPGDFAAVMSYLHLLIWPMMGAGFTVNWIERGGASLMRIGEFLDAEPEITSLPDAVSGPLEGDIEFRDLTLVRGDAADGKENRILDRVSLVIPEGRSLGILGRTGSGKSSLVSLLSRLLIGKVIFPANRISRNCCYFLPENQKNPSLSVFLIET